MLFLRKPCPAFHLALPTDRDGTQHLRSWPSRNSSCISSCQCLFEHFGASAPLSQPTIAVPNIQTRKWEALGSARLSAKDLVPSQAVWPGEQSSASLDPSILVCNKVK